jgi:hypothetical protein
MRVVRTILFILVCIGLIWLFVALMVRAFSGGNNTDVVEPTALITYANTNTEAIMAIDGPIVQNQEHEAVRIIVGRAQSQIQIIKGYDGQVVDQRTFPNTENSFEEFLAALDNLGFSQALVDSPEPVEQGVCPLGSRIVYTLEDGSDLIGRGWTASCAFGTFSETRGSIKKLFIQQIPREDFEEITKGLKVL